MKTITNKPFDFCLKLACALMLAFSSAPTARADADSDIPVIAFDGVSLRDAVTALAKQTGRKISFDPALLNQTAPDVSVKWRQVTANQALDALLANYDWQMKKDLDGQTFRISAREVGTVSKWKTVNLLEIARANGNAPDEVAPKIVFEKIPLTDGINALAIQASLNVQFSPRLANLSSVLATETWTNTTARQALKSIFDAHGLQVMELPGNPILRIAPKAP